MLNKEIDHKFSFLHLQSLDWKEFLFRFIYKVRESINPNAIEMNNRGDDNFKGGECRLCNKGLEDDYHVFIECEKHEKLRKKLINKVNNLLVKMFNIKYNEVSKSFPSWFSNSVRKFNKLGGMIGYIPIDVVSEFKKKFNSGRSL